MASSDPIIQQIITDITQRYAAAQQTNHVPDTLELVGLAVQLIEGQGQLTGVQKKNAVEQIVAGVIQQLDIPAATKEYLQQTLFKVGDLIEVALGFLNSNAALEAEAQSCFAWISCGKCGTPSKPIPAPFEVLKK